jgi:hypothetical protein
MTTLTSMASKLVDNLDKLPLGSILSYKEICLLLGEKEVSGNSRIRQAGEWNSYMVLEKVGKKFLIKQVFSPKDRTIDHLFNKDDIHIINSAKLLQTYLLRRVETNSTEDTEFEGVHSVTLFTKDIAMICGYIPETYYTYRTALKAGNVNCQIVPLLQMYLASVVRDESGKLLQRLLTSLKKSLLIVVREIHVGVKNMSQEELSDAQVAVFQSIKLAYITKTGQKDSQRPNTNTKVFREMLKDAGLDFINVYTAHKITYVEKDLRKALGIEEKQNAITCNNMHFKTRVRVFAENDDKKMAQGKLEKNTFKQGAFYSVNSMESIDWLLEEFLTFGEINCEEDS